MRADEALESWENLCCHLKDVDVLNYINQIRYERLMAKTEMFHHWIGLYVDSQHECNYKKYKEKCERIAEALEARAKRIKEGV